MGCGSSLSDGDISAFIAVYTTYQRDFTALRLTEIDVKHLYKVFIDLDEEGSGFVNISDICARCGVKETLFTRRALSIYDEHNKGAVTFHEFVVLLWNICTLSTMALVDYVFELYDTDGSKDIDLEEALVLITDMYGEQFSKNLEAVRVHREISHLKKVKTIDINVFHYFVKVNYSLMDPAYGLQRQLINGILGEEFWVRHGKRRVESYGSKGYLSADEILASYGRRNVPKVPAHMKAKKVRRMSSEKNPGLGSENIDKKSKEWRESRISDNNPDTAVGLDSFVSNKGSGLLSVGSSTQNLLDFKEKSKNPQGRRPSLSKETSAERDISSRRGSITRTDSMNSRNGSRRNSLTANVDESSRIRFLSSKEIKVSPMKGSRKLFNAMEKEPSNPYQLTRRGSKSGGSNTVNLQ
mmetsp:Transcript_7290/g.10839  ORF Transcript_7290/g.10839 Transcript_7290/m.10839 type:complete len:411 (-) Transcript_7290:260-1492(-)